ncbi:SpoIIE family protein phosphatase [Actinopolymorpha alba]|uniref:SpoIIE family protein phosphatase n=1 Tax=Actinopolymorpha alba TaxID=533267 RepID=UPI00036DA53F|nr:SpoIIE family protein phosphatase [Actinopolymorpha alba]
MTRPAERERLEALLDLTGSGVVLVDAAARIRIWNAAAESILGWSADDVLGQDAGEAMAAIEGANAGELLARTRANGTWESTVHLRHKNGEPVLCAVRARALDGSPDGPSPKVEVAARVGGAESLATAAESVLSASSLSSAAGDVLVVLAELDELDGLDELGGLDDRRTNSRRDDDERAALLRAERAARAELEHVRDRLAYVVHASSRLASSLDVGMTQETVGDLVVPRFGQLCIIDLWDGRRLDRVYVRDADPARQELAHAVLKLGGTHRDDHPAIRAVLTGRPSVVNATDPRVTALMYDDPQSREIVQEATQGRGFVSVPLITRGRVIGVLTLLGPGQAYDRELEPGEDLPVLEQIATRAAQSIENARLFDAERRLARNLQDSERRQRRAALTLQRSLLPAWTHQPAELEVATRYFPGAEEAEVGGDWYDVIPIAAGRTALVIGDVMGRGLRAATLMGQVRTAVRAYARQDLPPKEILDLLDGVVGDLGEAEIVTSVYAVFDRVRRTLTYASAGHLPILVVNRAGRARRLDHEAGLPLGVGTCAAPEHVVTVPEGTMVAFYTDGLVEHRQRDVDAGIDELVDALAKASGTLEGMCDQVIDALRPPAGYDDDVALLLARARQP